MAINKKEVKQNLKVPKTNSIKAKLPKDGFGMLSFMLISISVCLFLCIGLLTTTLATSEKIYFFKADKEQVSRLIDLGKPNHKVSIIGNWVADAMISVFDFSYVNIEDHINTESQKWFTEGGQDALVESLQSSDYFKEIISKKAIVELTVLQSPIFIDNRVNSFGRVEWLFQMPILITYIMKDTAPEVSEALITLSVERVPFSENAKGLGINKMIISR